MQFPTSCGALYQVTPTGMVADLHDFPVSQTLPLGGTPNPLIEGPGGNLYGTTIYGGTGACYGNSCGVFFQITPSGTFTIIHDFIVSDFTLIDLQPNCQDIDQRGHLSPKFCPSLDFYFIPPSGSWPLTITLTDSDNNILEQEALTFTSRNTAILHLIGSPACDAQLATTYVCGNPTALINAMDTVSAVMPTNSVILDISSNYATENLASLGYTPGSSRPPKI